jgi:hypothetical protein
VGMAHVARSEAVPSAAVHDDANDVRPPSDAAASPGDEASRDAVSRRARPPRPRDGQAEDAFVDDVSFRDMPAGRAPRVHDELIEAAQESAALEMSSPDVARAAVDAAGDTAPPAEVAAAARAELGYRDRARLEFERLWWRHAGSKEQAIRETFDLSATHYYRLLNALLDRPAAVEFDPLVVGRLRRLRASRARRRARR